MTIEVGGFGGNELAVSSRVAILVLRAGTEQRLCVYVNLCPLSIRNPTVLTNIALMENQKR